ncbi:DUF5977 domain-containing protein [Sediminibacterium soli]|uniref:DUF5977 domain-containing protein n=1 Tax=Sediminibacterium soli TaxID=2698829 RepID=UPI00137A4E98|nr:DUF5977 domain-containing protein [Sediminibacterium soli]NCI45659.1 hypothetical protein [Sediminibacterium soli]
MKKGHVLRSSWLLLLIIPAQLLFAQVVDDLSRYTDFLPAPPNAAAIAKYGSISLNKNTGAPNISIPLFTVKGNKLATGIALSYSSTGIKVDEIASRAGMGWALNMGGVISRTVRGVPDEQRPRAIPWAPIGMNWSTYNFASSIIKANNAQGNDGEPDLFTFNFNGYSGSFVFDPDMNPVMISRSDIRIAKDFNGTEWNFLMTTPDGIRYYFGGSNATEKTKRTSTCGKNFELYVNNAWYLVKIEHPNGEQIRFGYEPHTYSYQTGVSQTMYWVSPQPVHSCPTVTTCSTPPTATCVNTVQTQGVLLKSVEATGRVKAVISYRNRYDCSDSLVSSIELTDLVKNRPAGSFEMEYDDVVATGPANESGYGSDHTPFLNSLRERSADLALDKRHRFSYLDAASRAPRLSFSQDHWGFYNGRSNQSFVPKPDNKIPGGGYTNASRFPAASGNREPDAAYAKLGMLTRIDYPTGGYDSILYEGNEIRQAVDVGTLHRLMSGITGTGMQATLTDTTTFSIEQTQELDLLINCADNTGNGSFDPVHNKGNVSFINAADGTVYTLLVTPGTISHVYPLLTPGTYRMVLSANGANVTTNAVLEYKPLYTLATKNLPTGGIRVSSVFTGNRSERPVHRKYYYASTDSLHASSMNLRLFPQYFSQSRSESTCGDGDYTSCETFYLFANSINTLNDYQGSLVSYSSVVEGLGDHFEGGATETRFMTEKDGPGEVLFGYDFLNAGKTNYSNAFNGKVKEEILWKQTGSGLIPAKRTTHAYKLDLRGAKEVYGYSINGRYGLYPANSDLLVIDTTNYNPPFEGGTPLYQVFLKPLDILRYKVLCDWTYIDSTTEILYDENGQNPLADTRHFYYDTSAHTLVTRTEIRNSRNEWLKTLFQYPADFGGQAVYDSMISRNMLTPVGAVNYNNNAEISRQRIHFADWGNGNIAPSSIQKSFNANTLRTEMVMDSYDSAGNLLQFTGRDGIPNAVVWGYKNTYPVAKVPGATYAQVTGALTVTPAQLQNMDGAALQTELGHIRSAFPGLPVTTYTHQPLTGITAMVDANQVKTGFEYDAFNRLEHIRDNDSNLVKKIEYSLAGPGSPTAMPLYRNAGASASFSCQTCVTGYTATTVVYQVPAGRYTSLVSQAQADSLAAADISVNGQGYVNALSLCVRTVIHTYLSVQKAGTFTRQCAAGGTGSSVTYTVNAGVYTSQTSQADADNQAQAAVNANGQSYANSNGTCTFSSIAKSGTFTKQCAPGGTGSSVTYTVGAGAYTSLISQADADNQAQADVNANGQGYANSHGTCTFYNVVKSGTFTKQCSTGGTGSSVTYTVGAGAYTSLISQADADNQAQADVNANGQGYANSHGTCTFYNVAKSGIFTKQCDPGGTGSSVTYTVAAGTYASNSSQADADNQAQAQVNSYGQTYANNNGTCTFYNAVKSGTFTKQCDPGGTGSSVTYTVAAGTYASNSSQADADNQAQAQVNSYGQTYANNNGTCTFYNVVKSGTFTKQCDPGGTGSSVTYIVAAGTYASNSSQADADNQAQAQVNSYGQTYANNNGSCTFYNVAKSGTFQKQCDPGGTGSYVTYTVAAGTYVSYSSQANADNQAQAQVNSYGQTFANNNGTCAFYNVAKSGTFTKQCSPGGTGSSVTYTVPASSYLSYTSQADADNQAQNDVNTNGQNYANSHGTCTFYNETRSGTFQKQCDPGGTGSYVTYTVVAGTYASNSSQADANNQAQAQVNSYGQTYANNNGSCTFYNVAKSGTFQKQCDPGGTGSYVTYTVAAGTYVSYSSQADADNQAQAQVNSYGQTYANNNGTCTFYSAARSGSFQKQCDPGGTGSWVTYSVSAGAYTSNISQADADSKAQTDVNNNGQGYANSQGYCTYYSEARSGSFQKQCDPGGTGSYVTYTVAAGTYVSYSSQADANNQAQAQVNSYGQTYANGNGYCTWYNSAMYDLLQKNDCAGSGIGSYVAYSIPYATFSSNTSQAHADQLAQNYWNANAQNYVNSNGSCTWYNTAITQSFQKNDCGSYAVGSSVNYTVSAGSYSSNASQVHANQLAQTQVDTYGQGNANANGSCTYYNYAVSADFTKSCPAGYQGSTHNYTIAAWTYSSTSSQHDAQVAANAALNSAGQANADNIGTCTYLCTSGNCSGIDKKCVFNVCETGVKVVTNSELLGPRWYLCTYHYEWSDGSWSQDYTEESAFGCY